MNVNMQESINLTKPEHNGGMRMHLQVMEHMYFSCEIFNGFYKLYVTINYVVWNISRLTRLQKKLLLDYAYIIYLFFGKIMFKVEYHIRLLRDVFVCTSLHLLHLQIFCMEEWSAVSCEVFSKLTRHYRRKLRAVILEKGGCKNDLIKRGK